MFHVKHPGRLACRVEGHLVDMFHVKHVVRVVHGANGLFVA